MKETARYVGPDGEALHPGDRIGLEPPGCLKRDDRLDAWLTALRHELARACELPEKVMLCIRWHMGFADDKENWNCYGAAIEKYQNVLWTHTADMVASRVLGV